MADVYFPPRELEVMTVLWRRGSATVADVRDALDVNLAYTSVLSLLQILEDKEYVRHEPEGRAYRYFPLIDAEKAGGSALTRIREAIFSGSTERMFAQIVSDRKLTRKELKRMRRMLKKRLEEAP